MSDIKRLSFSTEMMRAALEGRKTQTRRVISHDPHPDCPYHTAGGIAAIQPCRVGEKLMLTSSWAVEWIFNSCKPSMIKCGNGGTYRIWQPQMGDKPSWAGKTRPAMFATIELAPLFPSAVVKSVRLERLQDISERNAEAEGVDTSQYCQICGEPMATATDGFRCLWDSINAKRKNGAWASNPWVWVIEFGDVKKGGAK